MRRIEKRQRGIAHVGLVILVVAVLGVIGAIGYFVVGKGQEKVAETVAEKAVQTALKAECDKLNDKDLCKFMSNWKPFGQYRMVSTDQSGGKTLYEMDGEKIHIAMSGEQAYETITIGNTIYTKAGDVWYKQTVPKTDTKNEAKADYSLDFEKPEEEEKKPEAERTKYTKLGKEACGKLQCFKYEVVEPEDKETKQTIWFDDKDYQLRRYLTQSPDGSSDSTVEYEGVKITAPANAKELGPDQYIMPGASEPVTMPGMSETDAPAQ